MGNIKSKPLHCKEPEKTRKKKKRSTLRNDRRYAVISSSQTGKVDALRKTAKRKDLTRQESDADAKTMRRSYSKNLAGLGGLQPEQFASPEIVIGDDDRTQTDTAALPYKAICLLEIVDRNNNRYVGTGFFISKRCVITAGHCLYFHSAWAKQVTVVPAANGPEQPCGKQVSSSFQSVEGWIKDGNLNFDYGAVLLQDDILFNCVGQVTSYQTDIAAEEIEVAGYPSDKFGTQWRCTGKVRRRSKFRLYHEADTVHGQSGSPIFINATSNCIVQGLHTYGDDPNFGIRVTPEMQDVWRSWSEL